MYKCFKFLKRIFLIFKNNILYLYKIKKILKKTPKNLIIRFLKILYLKKEFTINKFENFKNFQNYLTLKLNLFKI